MSGDPYRVHERAVMLTCDGWLGVLALPSVCATLGKRCPKWVRGLCEHADAIGRAVPRGLLEALARGEPYEKAAECEREAARVGEALGLCIVQGSDAGPTVQLEPTPFGFAVGFMKHARTLERLLCELEGAPSPARIGCGVVTRPELRRRLSGLARMLPPSIDGGEPRALPPSAKSSPPVVGGEGGSGLRTPRSVVNPTEPGPEPDGGAPARASFDAGGAGPCDGPWIGSALAHHDGEAHDGESKPVRRRRGGTDAS